MSNPCTHGMPAEKHCQLCVDEGLERVAKARRTATITITEESGELTIAPDVPEEDCAVRRAALFIMEGFNAWAASVEDHSK